MWNTHNSGYYFFINNRIKKICREQREKLSVWQKIGLKDVIEYYLSRETGYSIYNILPKNINHIHIWYMYNWSATQKPTILKTLSTVIITIRAPFMQYYPKNWLLSSSPASNFYYKLSKFKCYAHFWYT